MASSRVNAESGPRSHWSSCWVVRCARGGCGAGRGHSHYGAVQTFVAIVYALVRDAGPSIRRYLSHRLFRHSLDQKGNRCLSQSGISAWKFRMACRKSSERQVCPYRRCCPQLLAANPKSKTPKPDDLGAEFARRALMMMRANLMRSCYLAAFNFSTAARLCSTFSAGVTPPTVAATLPSGVTMKVVRSAMA